jgi:phenylalanyl-tRNA synthetase beta chain
VVVGEVLSVERHSQCRKLTVCKVKAARRRCKVVCGAPNVRVGNESGRCRRSAQGNPRRRKQGMLCSARELGLSDDHSGRSNLESGSRSGADVRAVLEAGRPCAPLKLTPNRADCLSVLGIARRDFRADRNGPGAAQRQGGPAKAKRTHPVRIGRARRLRRFAGRVIRNVDSKAPTPPWMKQAARSAPGKRSISALVDVTNYVMLELGRPLHVYDLDKLRGAINVRWEKRARRSCC